MAASFVSPVNILNVFFFLSFFFVRITEPVLEILIYFHVKVPVPGNARTHSSSWDCIRLQSPWAPSVPLAGRHSSHLHSYLRVRTRLPPLRRLPEMARSRHRERVAPFGTLQQRR
jgi:hypothetical protein